MTSDAISQTINHRTRRRIIEALWHAGEPLSLATLHNAYVESDQVTLATMGYHVRQLELEGIVKPERLAENGEQPFVLAGPNCAEAVRRLQLTRSSEGNGIGG